jgi:hypothetical protein
MDRLTLVTLQKFRLHPYFQWIEVVLVCHPAILRRWLAHFQYAACSPTFDSAAANQLGQASFLFIFNTNGSSSKFDQLNADQFNTA